MNTWNSDQYNSMMMPMMMGNMGIPMNMPPPVPPSMMGLIPGPPMIMPDWSQMPQQPNNNGNYHQPIDQANKMDVPEKDNVRVENNKRNSESKARDRCEIGRGRSTERSRDRNDRDKEQGERESKRARDRSSKWDSNKSETSQSATEQSNKMTAQLMQFNPMMPLDMNLRPAFTGYGVPEEMKFMAPMTMGRQPIYLSSAILLPVKDMTTQRSERPNGCHSILVSGFPESVTKEIVYEIFQRFGQINEVMLLREGVFIVRFERQETVELAFLLSGYVFKFYNQMGTDGYTIYIDYARNSSEQSDFRSKRREPSPVIEPCTQTTLSTLAENIKKDTEFVNVAPTLASWLERGECNKRNANTFYTLIQAANNQIHRLYNEKMQVDEEYQTLKANLKEKFGKIILQFEQVAKILSVAKHQRVSDHFSKQQRRNIDIWLKMTQDLENMKDEFSTYFDDEETERCTKDMVPLEKYENLKAENKTLVQELDGYKNEAYLAKTEAERKFEKFKAHYIAQQALENRDKSVPLFEVSLPTEPMPTSTSEDLKPTSQPAQQDAKLISLLTVYLISQPFGATLDNIVSYIQNLSQEYNQTNILNLLKKYPDLFELKIKDGARWNLVIFERIKST